MTNPQPKPPMRERTIKAGALTLTGYAAELILRLGSNLVLTRFLAPEAFGLMATALAIATGLTILTDVGIRSNVVRKSSALGPEFLHTAWTLQLLRGWLLWLLALVIAAIIYSAQQFTLLPSESLLAHPQFPVVLAVCSFIPATFGFTSTNLYVAERDLNFAPVVLRSMISRGLAFVVSLAWVLVNPSVWALAAGALTAFLFNAAMSHVLLPGVRMRLAWNRDQLRSLLGDGKWITLSSASGFLANQGDRIVLAALLSAEQMGLYAIAYTLAEVVRALLHKIHTTLSLPVLSEMFRTKPGSAKAAYYRYRAPIDALAFISAGFIFVGARDIVSLLYDDRYLGADWMLQALAFAIAAFPFRMINAAFLANDAWRSFSLNSVFLSVSFAAAVVLGYVVGGATGAIWGVVLHSWPATATLLYRAHQKGWISPWHEVRMVPLLLAGAALAFGGHFALTWLGVPL